MAGGAAKRVKKMQTGPKKAAKLKTFSLAQDFLPEHWDWDPEELRTLGDCESMAKVILNRLQDAGLDAAEAYVIKHDKDERELWNEYEDRYEVKFTSNHLHFLCKFGANAGETLDNIAKIVGVAPNYIAKPKTGGHAYDNMLSYLIHIKYPRKFQYEPSAVITVAGKAYIEHFRERRRGWMHGRAVRILAEAEYDLADVKRMIMEGEIDKADLVHDDRFKYVYQLHKSQLDQLVQNHNDFMILRNGTTYEEMKKREEEKKKRGY